MKTSGIKNIKKKSRQGAIISIIGFIVAIVAFTFSIVNQERTKKQLENNIQQTKVLADSTINLKTIVDSALIRQQKNIKIHKIISDYIKYFNSHNTDSISILLSDILSRYYLKTNIKRYNVIEQLRLYWIEYPEAKYNLDLNNMIISIYNKTNYQIIIKGNYLRDGKISEEVLSYIRLNSDYKIYFTRDYSPE